MGEKKSFKENFTYLLKNDKFKLLSILFPLLTAIMSIIFASNLLGDLSNFNHQQPQATQTITPVIMRTQTVTPTTSPLENQLGSLDQKINELITRQELLEQSLENSDQDSAYYDLSLEIDEIRESFDNLNYDLEKIENVILDDPEKALSTTLLRNEVETIRTNYESDIVDIKSDIERVYGQNRWFIGLMITSVLGQLTLAISNIVINTGNNKKEKKIED